jgi:DNA polymerase-3 subunit alpha
MSDFVHLHVQTQYSLLDGAIKLDDLMERANEYGMPAVGITDHGNMYGAVDFQKKAQDADIQPIIGCNMYVTKEDYTESTDPESYHLTLIAKNQTGYDNLTYINSMAWLHGYHERTETPRADKELIAEHSEGLICLSGDLGGEINQAILQGEEDEARRLVQVYQDMFPEDHFYLELIRSSLPEQQKCTDKLIEFSEEFDVPVVATNDCHYLEQHEAPAHGVLMSIQLGKKPDMDQLMDHGLDDLYFKSGDEMRELFSDIPEACDNTVKIAEMCDLEIPLGTIYLPNSEVPDDFIDERDIETRDEAIDEYFKYVARQGLEDRFEEFDKLGKDYDREVYEDRLEEEFEIILDMGFAGYFLIVWDFMKWSKEQGIPVGPGRGSGAGSLVAYAMLITDIDPMPYDLLFERFLNPERVSMPDFDIDFCKNRRDEVIDYVTQKYGEKNVAQIITYGKLKAKGCIRDVARAMSFSYGEADEIAKLIPDDPGITLEEALAEEPQLREMCDDNERVDTLFDIAQSLENLNRQAGMHAAGVVISEDPVWDYVPVCQGGDGELVTQYSMEDVEDAGLVKFDFLGLKTLTVIDDAVRLVEESRGEQIDIDSIPKTDQAAFDLIASGDTTGVFQLESEGFQQLLTRLKPDCFEDIIAAVALYRPGPLGSGMVDDFIARKHGREEVEYPHPWLEEVLAPTYGVMIYQEQVMKTAQIIGGFSLGEADLLRRAMGKKKEKVMAQQKDRFVDGAKDKGVDADKAEEIFELMAYFSGYGFNKSHSAAYALITYQTAYLKAHYPVEFMAALMTNDRDNTDKIVSFINETKEMGIEVLPPDVNESGLNFSVSDGKIRFGLGAVKGVGEAVVSSILEAREDVGSFESLYDFASQVDSDQIKKNTVEALVRAGAFDSIAPNSSQYIGDISQARASMFEAIETAVDHGAKKQHEAQVGQSNLLGMMSEDQKEEVFEETYPDVDPWDDRELLEYERELLGFYVTGHPLDRFMDELGVYGTTPCEHIATGKRVDDRDRVTTAGVVTSLSETPLKSGDGRMAFVDFEDKTGRTELLVFSNCFAEYEEVLKSGDPLLVHGQIHEEGDGENQKYKVRADEIEKLSEARQDRVSRVSIDLDIDQMSERKLDQLEQIIRQKNGSCNTRLKLRMDNSVGRGAITMDLPNEYRVPPTEDLMMSVDRLFGDRVVHFS